MEYMDWHAARSALEWQLELGAVDAIEESPVDRYGLAAVVPKVVIEPKTVVVSDHPTSAVGFLPEAQDPVELAEKAAAGASDLVALKSALAAFEYCDLKRGARSLVFSDGVLGSSVMILTEPPNREEDVKGIPFAGASGHLLDKMLAAIGLSRHESVYIGTIVPWRPPQDRDLKSEELSILLPFLRRHIELATPKILICMGDTSCQAILGKRGVSKLRGQMHNGLDLPVLPMFHPESLLNRPSLKSQAWQDLLSLKAWVRTQKET